MNDHFGDTCPIEDRVRVGAYDDTAKTVPVRCAAKSRLPGNERERLVDPLKQAAGTVRRPGLEIGQDRVELQ